MCSDIETLLYRRAGAADDVTCSYRDIGRNVFESRFIRVVCIYLFIVVTTIVFLTNFFKILTIKTCAKCI